MRQEQLSPIRRLHNQAGPMTIAPYYPYLSEAARDTCFAYLDSLAASQWPVASETRSVPTSYGPTFVRISGPAGAPPVVLLPGAGATSLMWAPNIDSLSTSCRTFAVDQIGEFGKSTCLNPIQSLSELLAWLDQFIDALQLPTPVSLVGMSYGGALAAQYALHFPQKLQKLVLLAPGATVLRPPAEFWGRLLLVAFDRHKRLPWFMRWIFADAARTHPEWVDGVLEQLSLNMSNVQRHRPPMPPVLTDAELARLAMPTLFLVGEHEVIYPAERAVRRLKRVAPRITAEIIPGAGHDLIIVQAARVNQRILQFLQPQPA
jgi:pimeloyl-ACP methyl ester carboxylesterase